MAQWDVIIVGGGPAGSTLACRLAPRWRVLVLERSEAGLASTPRIGESLPGAARVLLQRFGVFERFLQDQHAERGATISQWHSEQAVWFDHLRDPNGRGWHLDRTRFDLALRAAASAAGAQVLEACTRLGVSHKEGQWTLEFQRAHSTPCQQIQRAPIVVDASGRSATLTRQLGVTRRVMDQLICLYCHLPAASADVDQCTRLSAQRDGWWYSARLPSAQRVVAYHLDKDDVEHKTLRTPLALLTKAREIPLLAEVLMSHAPDLAELAIYARPAGSDFLDLEAFATRAPGVYAIGDALMAFDPIASQGIFHALASAESAAGAIEARLRGESNPDALHHEEMRAVYQRYRDHLRASYAQVQRFSDAPFWQRRCTSAAP